MALSAPRAPEASGRGAPAPSPAPPPPRPLSRPDVAAPRPRTLHGREIPPAPLVPAIAAPALPAPAPFVTLDCIVVAPPLSSDEEIPNLDDWEEPFSDSDMMHL